MPVRITPNQTTHLVLDLVSMYVESEQMRGAPEEEQWATATDLWEDVSPFPFYPFESLEETSEALHKVCQNSSYLDRTIKRGSSAYRLTDAGEEALQRLGMPDYNQLSQTAVKGHE